MAPLVVFGWHIRRRMAPSRARCLADPGCGLADLVQVLGGAGGGDAQTVGRRSQGAARVERARLLGGAYREVPAVIASPARDRSFDEHVRAGAAIARAAEASGKRVALIASADHGHAHDAEGPYGFDPASKQYDDRVVEIVRGDRLGDLLELKADFVEAAKADSFWQMLMLHGALGDGWRAELLSYEAPTYFGMLCAAYLPR